MAYNFGRELETVQHQIKVPISLLDDDDVVISIHWIADTLRETFGTETSLPFLFESEQTDGPDEFVELFVNTFLLREYPSKGANRWEIHRDLDSGPIKKFSSLKDAIIGLILMDTEQQLQSAWSRRFGSPSSQTDKPTEMPS